MQLKTKVAIDRVVGSILVWLALALRRRKRGKTAAPIEPDHFVILKLLGLGSMVQASPLIAALKDRYPGARFTFLTKKGNDELVRRIPLIDSTLTIDDASLPALAHSLPRAVAKLRALDNVCFINLEAYSKLGVLLTLSSGAALTAGFFRNPSDLKLERAFDFLVYFNPVAPISEVYLQLGRALGTAEFSPALARLTVSDTDEAEVDALLGAAPSTASSIILVNPNSSELRLERRWPAVSFAGLISELLSAVPECRVLLIGAAGERAHVQSVYDGVSTRHPDRVSNIAGALSLGGLIALVARARLMITNDSGPMHVAFSLGIPTVSLFGPAEPGHNSFEGAGGPHAILYHRVYCSPCVHHFDVAPCRGNNVCMKLITREDVLNAALRILRAEPVAQEKKVSIVYGQSGKPFGVLNRAGA